MCLRRCYLGNEDFEVTFAIWKVRYDGLRKRCFKIKGGCHISKTETTCHREYISKLSLNSLKSLMNDGEALSYKYVCYELRNLVPILGLYYALHNKHIMAKIHRHLCVKINSYE